MNSHEQRKKDLEKHDLELFLQEHEIVTEERTHIVESRERPDFIVQRGSELFGVELVQVVESPEMRFFRQSFYMDEQIDLSDASVRIQEAIYKKEEMRQSRDWAYYDSTILVVQLRQTSSTEIFSYLEEEIISEISATGFVEIWLMDHGPEEEYGTVELICVKPECWRGLYRHSLYGNKPYG